MPPKRRSRAERSAHLPEPDPPRARTTYEVWTEAYTGPPEEPPLLSDIWNQWKQKYPDEERKRPHTHVWQPPARKRAQAGPLEKGWTAKVPRRRGRG